jgi:hypothetical protein
MTTHKSVPAAANNNEVVLVRVTAELRSVRFVHVKNMETRNTYKAPTCVHKSLNNFIDIQEES